MIRITILFFVLTIFISGCSKKSETITLDYLDCLILIDSFDCSVSLSQLAEKMKFEKKEHRIGDDFYYELELNDTLYFMNVVQHENECFSFLYSFPSIGEKRFENICKKKFGDHDGVDSYNNPVWEISSGFICVSNKRLTYSTDEILDYAELHQFPKMPSSEVIENFIKKEGIYEFGQEVNRDDLNLIQQDYLDSKYVGVFGDKLQYSFYYSEMENTKNFELVELLIPFRKAEIDLKLLDNKLPQLFSHYDELIRSMIDTIEFKELKRFQIFKNQNYVINVYVNEENPFRSLLLRIWKRPTFNNLTHSFLENSDNINKTSTYETK